MKGTSVCLHIVHRQNKGVPLWCHVLYADSLTISVKDI